jgi:pyruvate dehydrogenase E2 component (dihydrolipoamide acetyltransferase)
MSSLTVPHLSMGMEEVRVVRWLVADGAEVVKGQPVVEIETDKATHEVEVEADGPIRIVAAEGASVPVDGVLATIGEVAREAPVAAAAETASAGDGADPPRSDAAGIASPAARRLAREAGVDLATVVGTGPGGRVLARDIESAPAAAPSSGLRDAVVRSLAASWREIPHIHIVGELDAEGLVVARRSRAEQGRPVTVTDLLAFALTRALVDVPGLNGFVRPEGPRLEKEISIALAVATSNGVVAPVIRNAAALSLDEIAGERERLVGQARAGSLDGRDLADGTVTLTNLGNHPVDFFMPIVSGPQIAAVATGRVKPVPAAVDGMIAVRHRIVVNVAIDHRGADGEAGGRLLAALEGHIRSLSEEGR